MRIKAVLRDIEILKMEPGSKERILASAKKNLDRVINWPSLLKVMGLTFDERIKMLQELRHTKLHIWLVKDADQHLIFLTESENAQPEISGYAWQ
ncbi:MAG: hypothetical protein JW779_15945 [Candidatus Thorarchaeota archaeon]|nr:hypothetical protein [Candidatus Thorarchaeota archaeon]